MTKRRLGPASFLFQFTELAVSLCAKVRRVFAKAEILWRVGGLTKTAKLDTRQLKQHSLEQSSRKFYSMSATVQGCIKTKNTGIFGT